MAAIRSGAWSRRAILRAAGWWESAADELISRELSWRRDGRTLSLGTAVWLAGSSSDTLSSGFVLSLASVHQLDTLMANLITLAALTNRTPVAPHFLCSIASSSRVRQVATVFSSSGREPLCAWVPPAECYMLEYLLPTELSQLPGAALPPREETASRRPRHTACGVRGLADGVRGHTTGPPERIHRLARRALCDEAQHASLLGGLGSSALSVDETRDALRWLKHWPFGPSLLSGDERLRSAWQAATAGPGRRENVSARCLHKLVAGAVSARTTRKANSSKLLGSTSYSYRARHHAGAVW